MTPLFKPYMPDNIIEEIHRLLYSGQLINSGWSKRFEESLSCYLSNELVLATNSYLSALNVAFSTFDIGFGDEVIMSPMCCLQSSQPLIARGIKVVWADIDPNTGTLCPDDVIEKISSKTKAIFHNHHLGYVGYIDEINDIAKKYGLFTIDDCLDGIGGVYNGNKVGNVGSDATVFSFNAVRLPNAIEGGAVSFSNSKYYKDAVEIRDQGIDRSKFRDSRREINEDYDVSTKGLAAIPTELHSFIAYKQMSELDKLIEIQAANVEQWIRVIERDNLNITPLDVVNGTKPNNWVFGVLSNKKIEWIDYFREKGYYASGVHLNNNRYSLFGKSEELKGVNEFYNKFFALPSGWWVEL